MDAQYRILYSGNLLPGQELSQVEKRLAKKFRMREETARDLILKGGGRVLKQSLSAEEAERYRAALTAVGLVITIEPQDTSTPQTESLLRSYPINNGSDPKVPLSKPAEPRPAKKTESSGSWSKCPKCGANEVSDLTGVCQACGIVVERYLSAQGGSPADGTAVDNPYAPPQADLTTPEPSIGGDTLYPPRGVRAGRGWAWIAEAWALFKEAPGAWVGAFLVFMLIYLGLSLVPFVGSLAATILGPMLTAGLIMGAHGQMRGQRFTVSKLFAGFSEKPGPLALIGVVYLGFAIGLGILVAIVMGVGLAASGAFSGNMDPASIEAMAAGPAVLLPLLIVMLIAIPLVMAIFFAPALVALNDVPIFEAFKLSFMGCLKNILPFLVYGLIAFVLAILAMLPLLLGLLIVGPVFTIVMYTAYRDIYYR